MHIYKYRANQTIDGEKRDTALLVNDSIYASNLQQQNDPFEGSVQLPQSFQDDIWVTPIIQELREYGVCSFSIKQAEESFPSNELLWAHYGNSHKGFCIEFDLDLLNENCASHSDLIDIIQINYNNERPEILKKEKDSIVRQKIFGSKSIPWQYENEIRLVFKSPGIKQVMRESIKTVYFGLNISLIDRDDIVRKLKGSGIKLFQMERVENQYKLEAKRLVFDFDNYEVINKESLPTVDNIMILYKSINKDKNTIVDFVQRIRKRMSRPTNITIIDDIRAKSILDNYKPRNLMSTEEISILSRHWIAYSTFDAPECTWYHPECYW